MALQWRFVMLVGAALAWCGAASAFFPQADPLAIARQKVQANPNDPQRAVWLADLGRDLLYVALPKDGALLTALFGLAPPSQMETVQQDVAELADVSHKAEMAINQAILQVESLPDYATSSDPQQKRRELAEVFRDLQIPYLRGVAAVLEAELLTTDSALRQTNYARAVTILSPLVAVLPGTAGIDSAIYLGLAHSRLGAFDAAEQHFSHVAKDSNATVGQIFSARLGGVINRTKRGGAAAGLEALNSIVANYPPSTDAKGPSNFFFRLLIADHRAHLHQSQNQMLSALNSYMELLRTEIAVPRDVLHAVVFDRLANIIPADFEITPDIPGGAVVAHAERLAQQSATREKAITLLEQSLSNNLFDHDSIPAALFALGKALYAHGQSFFAAERLLELAAQHPTDRQAPRAVELGVSIAAEIHRHSPLDQESRTLLRRGLRLLLERYVNLPSIDRWRYAAAELALLEQRLDDATVSLQQITPDSPQWIDAHVLAVAVQMARTARAATPAEQSQSNEQMRPMIERARSAIEQAVKNQPDTAHAMLLHNHLSYLRLVEAQTLLQSQRPAEAIAKLQEISGEREQALNPATRAQLIKARIEAYQSLHEPEKVIQELQRLVTDSPADATSVLLSMSIALHDEVQSLRRNDREQQATDLASRSLLPTAKLLEQSLNAVAKNGSTSNDHFHARRRVADAYQLAGQWNDALPRYEQLLAAQPSAGDALVGKAECLFAFDDEARLAAAMEIYKRLAAAGPNASHNSHETYWLSQLRMLQILDRMNRNTEQITPRIEQLRQKDRDFGGEHFRQQFEKLRLKYVKLGTANEADGTADEYR